VVSWCLVRAGERLGPDSGGTLPSPADSGLCDMQDPAPEATATFRSQLALFCGDRRSGRVLSARSAPSPHGRSGGPRPPRGRDANLPQCRALF
jgi:hypothetical protein